jgi:hypothetical protein
VTVRKTFHGSDGEATRALYARLAALGPAGEVAINVMRAVKCSARAKVYRGRGYRQEAYGRKSWSMANLCAILTKHGRDQLIPWGWREDAAQEFHRWVLYVDLPTGQVSFHGAERMAGPDYDKPWDPSVPSDERAIRFAEALLGERAPESWPAPAPTKIEQQLEL